MELLGREAMLRGTIKQLNVVDVPPKQLFDIINGVLKQSADYMLPVLAEPYLNFLQRLVLLIEDFQANLFVQLVHAVVKRQFLVNLLLQLDDLCRKGPEECLRFEFEVILKREFLFHHCANPSSCYPVFFVPLDLLVKVSVYFEAYLMASLAFRCSNMSLKLENYF